MTPIIRLSVLSLLIGLLATCSPSREELSAELLQRAQQAYQCGLLGTAKVLVDSLQREYLDVPSVYRDSKTLMAAIRQSEQERTKAYVDSLLAVEDSIQQTLMTLMAIDDKTALTPLLVAKGQQTSRSLTRCHLRATTDQIGTFALTSNFTGQHALGHTHLRVTVGNHYVLTDTTTTPAYSFTNGEQTWEILKISQDEARNLARFIAENVGERICVELRGGRYPYKYYLTDVDKQAVRDVLALADSYQAVSCIR